jgi:signal transduction histidine kinase
VEVLVNLFENARDAGARRVGVRVRSGAGDGLPWAAVVTIADDGGGIPADLLPRVFEPRFSATSSGSGLGLAIVKRLVDDWGAEVTLESAVGSGTTVTIRLRAPIPATPRLSV